MKAHDNPSTRKFQQLLARGELAFGNYELAVEVDRNVILEKLDSHLSGKPKEWKAGGHHWNRDEMLIDILWYPQQSVFLTFDNGYLSLIEFSGSGKSDFKWDYSLEIRRYYDLKNDALKHLGDDNRSNESNDNNLEVSWEFAKLVFYIACDSRTGGCGIGLRVKLGQS
jgi:hypothetical protein